MRRRKHWIAWVLLPLTAALIVGSDARCRFDSDDDDFRFGDLFDKAAVEESDAGRLDLELFRR